MHVRLDFRLALWIGTLGSGLVAGCDTSLTVPFTALAKMEQAVNISLGSTTACTDERNASCAGNRGTRKVSLSAFYMDVNEVTRGQFEACRGDNGCHIDPKDAYRFEDRSLPVLVDSRKAAEEYCAWSGKKQGLPLSLPTEAEFEYAARFAKDKTLQDFPWGKLADGCGKLDHGACGGNTGTTLGPVGSHPEDTNGAGIHDLAGSVPEWTSDDYTPFIGCLDRLDYAAMCGKDTSCPETRCGSDASCLRGCLPDDANTDDSPASGRFANDPVCPTGGGSTTPFLDPVFVGGNEAVVKGGLGTERACTLASYTRRHLPKAPRNGSTSSYGAGFRCVERARDLLQPTSYRFTLAGCPSPDWQVQVSVKQMDDSGAAYALDVVPPRGAALGPFAPLDGTVRTTLPCGGAFILRPLSLTPVVITVTDAQPGFSSCVGWSIKPALDKGDVPLGLVQSVPLAGGGPGMCGIPNGIGDCRANACATACTAEAFTMAGKADTFFRDCNATFTDGCETDVHHDLANCGACNSACPTVAHTTYACLAGACAVAGCGGSFSNCDQDVKNGCEIDLGSDPANCGACRTPCSANNMANVTCGSGVCNGPCVPGFADCNGDKKKDGCEITLGTDANCHACGDACANPRHCVNGACQ